MRTIIDHSHRIFLSLGWDLDLMHVETCYEYGGLKEFFLFFFFFF